MEARPQPTRIRIELTDEQKDKLRQIAGRDVERLEFSVMELEDRIAPALSRN
jgi:hypothetical protein